MSTDSREARIEAEAVTDACPANRGPGANPTCVLVIGHSGPHFDGDRSWPRDDKDSRIDELTVALRASNRAAVHYREELAYARTDSREARIEAEAVTDAEYLSAHKAYAASLGATTPGDYAKGVARCGLHPSTTLRCTLRSRSRSQGACIERQRGGEVVCGKKSANCGAVPASGIGGGKSSPVFPSPTLATTVPEKIDGAEGAAQDE